MIAAFLAERSPRERGLLAVLGGLALPLAFLLTVASPLLQSREAARAALASAEETRQWYRARQSEIAALPQGQGPVVLVPGASPVGLGGIEARLTEAGLRRLVSTLADAPDGGVSLALTEVEFTALMAWIGTVEGSAGYRLGQMRLVPTGRSGLVNAELRLEPDP